MDYTSAEILTATTRLVRDAIRRPYGILGNRDIGTTLTDIQDAAAGVFLLFQNAPFYTLFLGTERVGELVASEAETLTELINAVIDIGRNVTTVDSITTLNNASAALGALSQAANTRAGTSSGTFESIEDVPAWKRFDDNIQRFLNEHSKNIKSGSSVVDTPAGARAAIPGLLTSVKQQHAELIRRVTLLEAGLTNFNSLQLRATLQASILVKAQEVLDENIALLDRLTPEARLGELRSVTLDLLAARAVVRSFGSLTSPTLFALIDGVGAPFADSSHPATPAQATATIFSPYTITPDANQLDVFLDGSSSITSTVAIQGSFIAKLDGLIAEPFDITGGSNDAFDIDLTDETRVPVTLVADATKSIEDVVSEINADIAGTAGPPPVVAEAYFNPLKFTGGVIATTGPDTFTFISASVSPAALQVVVGDKVVVVSGDNAGNIYAIGPITEPVPPSTPGFLVVTLLVGAHVAATNDVIEIGDPLRLLRIRITDAAAVAALAINQRLDLPDTGDITTLTLQTLGFQSFTGIASRRTTADEVVDSVDLASGSSIGLTKRLEASKDFTATLFTGQGHTVTTTSLRYVLFKLRVDGITMATVGPTTTFTVPSTSAIQTGDIVALRETGGSNDINAFGTITVISSTQFTVPSASWSSDDPLFVTPPADSTDVLLDVGPNIVVPNDAVLRIAESSLNDGEYTVSYSGVAFPNSIPFELPMTRSLPFINSGGQPIINNVELGQEKVVFSSTDVTLSTQIRITDGDVSSGPNPLTAIARFFLAPPVDEVGLTTFFQIPEDPKTLEAGDQLELYENSYNVVSQAFIIQALELSLLLIELETTMDTDLGNFTFTTTGQVPPFVRIRKIKRDNFDVFSADADIWLELPENEKQFFTNLDALINPLLSNTNPSIVEINTAKLALQGLLGILTTAGAVAAGNPVGEDIEAILGSYDVSTVSQVDALVDSFLEKGSDRAVDLLLEGQFTTFFGLPVDGQSYAGDVIAKIKEVQRLDLPVKKVRRADAGFDQIVAQWQEPDFEFDQSDIEDFGEVDIPTDFDKPFPGGAF